MDGARVTKGLAGVTKGMTVRRPYARSIDIRRLYVPVSGGVVERASTFVAGGSAGALMKGRQDMDAVFTLDVHRGHRTPRSGDSGSGGGSSSNSGRGLIALAGSALGSGGHAGVERGELVHHALVLLLLVGVDGLGVLAEVVEA